MPVNDNKSAICERKVTRDFLKMIFYRCFKKEERDMTKETGQNEIKYLLSEYPQIKQDVEAVAEWLADTSTFGEWYVRKALRDQASTMRRAISKMENTTVHNYTWSYKRAQAMVRATIGEEARKRVCEIPSFISLSGLCSAEEEAQGNLLHFWNEWCREKDLSSAIPHRPWETYGEQYRDSDRWSTGPRDGRQDIYQPEHTVPGTWKGIGPWLGIDEYSGPDSSLLLKRCRSRRGFFMPCNLPTDNLWEKVAPPHFYPINSSPPPPPPLLVNQELHDVTEWFGKMINGRKADTIQEAVLQEEFRRIFGMLSRVRDELRSIKKI